METETRDIPTVITVPTNKTKTHPATGIAANTPLISTPKKRIPTDGQYLC
jgi:hypothetical protein